MTSNRNSCRLADLGLLFWVSLVALACGSSGVAPIGAERFQLEDDEQRLWNEARELQVRFDRSGLIDQDPALTSYVNRVAATIAPDNVKDKIRLEIKVLKNPAPNAFALPHGLIYVHTGFLARMENEAQLAAVLGHEISHIAYRHTLQTFRNVRQGAAFASTLGVIGAPAGLYGLGVVMLGSLGALAAVSGYSQSLEEEADAEGLRTMARSGYDPRQAVKVMENVKRYLEQEEIKEPYFFSTHPRVEERTASYQRLLDRHYREPAGWLRDDVFAAIMSRTVLENALGEISRGRFALAEESIEKCLERERDNSKAHFALAELFRRRGLEADRQRSETEYKMALGLDSRFADAHRGIGLLYYKIGRADLAREHFRSYLLLSPGAKDRAYIQQYLREIDGAEHHP
jgi:Zn-dependent protease with chaperone function